MKNNINIKNANRGLQKKESVSVAVEVNSFDYTSLLNFSDEEKNTLKNNGTQLKYHMLSIMNSNVEIGKILEDSRVLFSRHPESDSYMEWYKSLGLNKDQVLQCRNLYEAVVEAQKLFPNDEEKLNKIKMLSARSASEFKKYKDKVLQETVNKGLLEFVATSDKVPSSADLKKVRLELEEKNSHIEEAQIVETSKKEKTKLKELMEEKVDIEKDIKKKIAEITKIEETLTKLNEELKGLQIDLKVVEDEYKEEEERVNKEAKVVEKKPVEKKKNVKKEVVVKQ